MGGSVGFRVWLAVDLGLGIEGRAQRLAIKLALHSVIDWRPIMEVHGGRLEERRIKIFGPRQDATRGMGL